MRSIFTTLAVALAFGACQQANACGMIRMPIFEEKPVLLLADARQAERIGDNYEALRKYEKVMRNWEASDAHRSEGAHGSYRIRAAAGEDKALARLHRAVELNPRNALAQLDLARELVDARPRRASVAARKAIRFGVVGSDRGDAHVFLSLAYSQTGKDARAERHRDLAAAHNASAPMLAKLTATAEGPVLVAKR